MKETFNILMSRVLEFDENVFSSDWRWKLLEELYNKNWVSCSTKEEGIPKIIHQIWLGSPLPEKYKEWTKSWKKFNPNYEYRLWTDKDIPGLKMSNMHNFERITNYGVRSDIMRYNILNRFGGIYADTDFECLRSFSDFEYLNFFISVGYPTKVELYPGLIGCTPNNPIMSKIVEGVSTITVRDLIKNRALATTGAYFFTDTFFKVIQQYTPGVLAFPPADYFYPFPNYKGHKMEDGRKYIKEDSYAIHYWEVSWINKNAGVDWVQGDKFAELAHSIYSPRTKCPDDYLKYENSFDPCDLKPVNIVYTNVMYVGKLLKIVEYLPNEFIIIAHNGDHHFGDGKIRWYNGNRKLREEEEYSIPDNVRKLFVMNVDVKHPKIEPIPIGLENDMWKESWDKRKIIEFMMSHPSSKSKLLLVNHNVDTNPGERNQINQLFVDKDWATVKNGKNGNKSFTTSFKEMGIHKFMACPEGNGIDTHRTWECLYIGCIPVMKRSVFTSFFEHLPICFVNNWEEITEDFLNKEYERISKIPWGRQELSFEYWKNKIKSCYEQ